MIKWFHSLGVLVEEEEAPIQVEIHELVEEAEEQVVDC